MLATQVAHAPVQLIAIHYNWGPPASGRFDVDFLQLWAAARAQPVAAVFLHGERSDGTWSLDLPLTRLCDFSTPAGATYTFYELSLRAQHDFPRQFVLRLERANQSAAYAKDHGENYRIQPFTGRGMSAIRKGSAIYDLGRITPCRLFAAPPDQAR